MSAAGPTTRGVLIVDDDQFIRRLIATTLEDVSQFVDFNCLGNKNSESVLTT